MSLLPLADQPTADKTGEAILEALSRSENASDRWIPDAATAAAAKNAESFLRALAAAKQPNSKLLEVAGTVAEHYARGGPVDSVGSVVAKLADADPAVADAVVRGLAKGWPWSKPPKRDEQTEKALARLAATLAPDQRGVLVRRP